MEGIIFGGRSFAFTPPPPEQKNCIWAERRLKIRRLEDREGMILLLQNEERWISGKLFNKMFFPSKSPWLKNSQFVVPVRRHVLSPRNNCLCFQFIWWSLPQHPFYKHYWPPAPINRNVLVGVLMPHHRRGGPSYHPCPLTLLSLFSASLFPLRVRWQTALTFKVIL